MFSCTQRTAESKYFELILTVKMETRHLVGGLFSREFSAFVIFAELWRRKVARPGNCFLAIFAFLWKNDPSGKSFKIRFRKFLPPYRLTFLCWNVLKFVLREIGEIVHYLPHKKFSSLSNHAVATARMAPKICQDIWLTTFKISSKSVHFRRSYSRTREGRLWPIEYL